MNVNELSGRLERLERDNWMMPTDWRARDYCAAGSMLLRRRSAASHSLASKPRLPVRSFFFFAKNLLRLRPSVSPMNHDYPPKLW